MQIETCFPGRGGRLRHGFLLTVALASLLPWASSAAAATFAVNTTGDAADVNPGDGVCSTGIAVAISPGVFEDECTLRAAIQEANALAGSDTIEFSSLVPTAAGFVQIAVASQLPFLADPVLIDGASAAGYDVADPFADPIINIGGQALSGTETGLTLFPGASGTVLRGLAIHSFPGNGISISAANDVVVEGCHIGISQGTFHSGRGNGANGILVFGATTGYIGRTCDGSGCTGKGNVISTNGESGISIASDGVEVAGNLIGTDVSGNTTSVPIGGATPNAMWGVHIVSGERNEIGGFLAEAGNLISGNGQGGIRVDSRFNSIRSNRIGTNLAGLAALPNQGPGVDLTIGSNSVGALGAPVGNLISGNTGDGIRSTGANDIVGNTIGLDLPQLAKLGNGESGIELSGSSAIVEDNVIGGNENEGILADGERHEIVDNLMGTNANRDDLTAFSPDGIRVRGDSIDIGAFRRGNIIGFYNTGIEIEEGSDSNVIQGNFIGVDPDGVNIRNDGNGISVFGAFNRIGGPVGPLNGSANVIGFNGINGIRIFPAAETTRVIGNYIGTNASGDDLGNRQQGVFVNDPGHQIGALAGQTQSQVADRANVIAFNGLSGVAMITGADPTGTSVRGNQFFSNAGLAIDLFGNGPTPNDVGDTDEGVNSLQNHPQIDPAQTGQDPITGDLEVRYRVDSNLGESAYPLDVDFYLINAPGGQADVYVGSDVYPAASATQPRSAVISPLVPGPLNGLLRATATDADGKTSELSRQSIAVPEPGWLTLLAGGLPLLVLFGRARPGRSRVSSIERPRFSHAPE